MMTNIGAGNGISPRGSMLILTIRKNLS